MTSDTTWIQGCLDDIGESLADTTFVVVDLETTGGSPQDAEITEIGAVKVRAGETLGEFHTLVRPNRTIPAFITTLTGISNAMVSHAPTNDTVLPMFFEFAHSTVLVAHNARFDIGFLKFAAQQCGYSWPSFRHIDTVLLARKLLTRDEVPNCKLITLANYFRAPVSPTHRALDDARATVHVLHALIERLGSFKIFTLDDMQGFLSKVTPLQREKRQLAAGLPQSPGVYIFRDASGEPLYIGTSQNIRDRVASYFTASETRSRMQEMIGLADRVDAIPCAHSLEAQVRELRLIAERKPPYNRRSKFPERNCWITLTAEPFPRLSIVRTVRNGQQYLGPFSSRGAAEQVIEAVCNAVPLRRCTDRLSLIPQGKACVLADLDKCSAPCDGRISVDEYALHTEILRNAITADPRPLIAPLQQRLEQLSDAQRYEDASAIRDQIMAIVRSCAQFQELVGLTRIAELVAALPTSNGGWELIVVRHGRLAAAGCAPNHTDPVPYVEALVATAETVACGHGPAPAALVSESQLILRWLSKPGLRIVHASEPWCNPAWGASGLTEWLDLPQVIMDID